MLIWVIELYVLAIITYMAKVLTMLTMNMYLPTLARQRSVPKATFLYDSETFHVSGDFSNVYYQCFLPRVVPTSKKK